MGLNFLVKIKETIISYLKPLSIPFLVDVTVVILACFVIPVIGDDFSNDFKLIEENRRFAFQRCQNESNVNAELISLWNKWKFPNNTKTHCYIKCFLYKLGLINLKTMGLDEYKFMIILRRSKSISDEPSISDSLNFEELFTLEIFQQIDGTCRSYYTAWLYLIELFGLENDKIRFLNLNTDSVHNSKPLGQMGSIFCLKNLEERSNSSQKIKLNKCLTKCIYQHFHFIDAYGRVDVKEILQCYLEASQSGLQLGSEIEDTLNTVNIEKCAHTANQIYYQGLCLVASKLHKCLIENVINYDKIFMFRDNITIYY